MSDDDDVPQAPPEVVSDIARRMRGTGNDLSIDEQIELELARERFRAESEAAQECASQRLAKQKCQEEIAAEREAQRIARAERSAALKANLAERQNLYAEKPSDPRLDAIAAESRRAAAFRTAVIRHGAQQELGAAFDEIFSDWRRFVGIKPELPVVRLEDDDE
jgi:hypothetical protein